jgi:DNA processing protein
LALSRIPGIGDHQAKVLLDQFETAEEVFRSSHAALQSVEGIGPVKAQSICEFSDWKIIESELAFCEKYSIDILTVKNKRYPSRLLHCADAPLILFHRGSGNPNARKVISIVGTRTPTRYGSWFCEELIKTLTKYDVMVVSGLAFGIDACAHKSCIQKGLSTYGVLAHGLDRLYPEVHRPLARNMIEKGGGLLTDFWTHSKPDKQNFPKRNRIVAGMCDALIVVETGKEGGSMITAELANSYHREVFALPGRTIDAKSSGCNQLIQYHKATILREPSDLPRFMNWEIKPEEKRSSVSLFTDMDPIGIKVLKGLQDSGGNQHFEGLRIATGLLPGELSTSLLQLEIKQLLVSLPGGRYQITMET